MDMRLLVPLSELMVTLESLKRQFLLGKLLIYKEKEKQSIKEQLREVLSTPQRKSLQAVSYKYFNTLNLLLMAEEG